MARKRGLNKTQREAQKLKRNIQRTMNRWKNKGFETKNILQDIPKYARDMTRSDLAKLRKITNEQVRSSLLYDSVPFYEGGYEQYKLDRENNTGYGRVPEEALIILDNHIAEVEGFKNDFVNVEAVAQLYLHWLDNKILMFGRIQIARGIKRAKNAMALPDYTEFYDVAMGRRQISEMTMRVSSFFEEYAQDGEFDSDNIDEMMNNYDDDFVDFDEEYE